MPDKTIDIRKSDIIWSHDLTPVEGWTAERADLNMWHYGNGMSYRVYACPEYEEE